MMERTVQGCEKVGLLTEEGLEMALPQISGYSGTDDSSMLLKEIGEIGAGFGCEFKGNMEKLTHMGIEVRA